MDFEGLSEEQVLQRLLDADTVPEKTVKIERLGIPVTLKGLRAKEVFRLREKYTMRKEKRGQVIEQLDDEGFNAAIIVAATVKPNWADPRLLSKYQASGPEEVVKRVFLAGELAQLGNIVLELSGFDTELEEVKNS